MRINFKYSDLGKSLLIFTMGLSTMWLTFGYREVQAQSAAATVAVTKAAANVSDILCINEQFSRANLLTANICENEAKPSGEESKTVERIKVVLTAYSSTVAQTDSTPFITANGTYVHDGVVANNGLPFGTEIKIPELYGDKVFSVEDRMHWRKSDYQFDIWFPTYEQAKNFGVRYAYVEILENN